MASPASLSTPQLLRQRPHRRLAAMLLESLVPSLTTRHGGPSGALGLGLGSVSARRARHMTGSAPERLAPASGCSGGGVGLWPRRPRPCPSGPHPAAQPTSALTSTWTGGRGGASRSTSHRMCTVVCAPPPLP